LEPNLRVEANRDSSEGGSGKSTEFGERDRELNAQGKFSSLLTVKKVAAKGFQESLLPKQSSRFERWLASNPPAWFFVDSVDEAKAAGIPLADALAQVADTIEGAERRAHVIFFGRPTEWEYHKDLHAIMASLPEPSPSSTHEAIDFDQAVIKAINRERAPPEPPSAKRSSPKS
jgi:hypothetical protein